MISVLPVPEVSLKIRQPGTAEQESWKSSNQANQGSDNGSGNKNAGRSPYIAKAENDRRKTGMGLERFLQSEGAVRVNEW